MKKINTKNIRCPTCDGKNTIRYGWRNQKPVYYCKTCNKKFTNTKFQNKTYSPAVITNAITYYNLGNTLEETAKIVNRRFKVKVSKSSIQSWIKEFSDICSYNKIRGDIVKKYKDEIIPSFPFKHGGLVYTYKFHQPKIEMKNKVYPSLESFLKNLHSFCPSDFFDKNQRCSQLKFDVKFQKTRRYNQACKLAELSLKSCRKNTKRHEFVEDFMLINDSCTVACEVPVWFWEKNLDMGICGHIDLLQLRQGYIYILDFKPDAEKENEEKVTSQLFLYASGLSFRTKIPLDRFRCAWFDEKNYYEFKPKECKVKVSK